MTTYMDTTGQFRGSDVPVGIINVPIDRLEIQTAAAVVAHKPACVIDDAAVPGAGKGMHGTILDVDTVVGIVGMDTRRGMIFHHQVRNVLTYSGTAESTFALLNFGMPVYYDRSSTMPSGVLLSLSPLDNNGVANKLFGYITWKQTEEPNAVQGDRDPYPLGSDSVGTTHTDIAIWQA